MNAGRIVWVWALAWMLMASMGSAETFGVKKRMQRPDEFGNVIINSHSTAKGVAPVVFAHWLHRMRYTCRVCHVDLGFAMAAGGTGIREDDIRNGRYCGACHNGTDAFGREEKSGMRTQQNCVRCHSYGKEVEHQKDFYKETAGFPRARFGNRVDWMKAEEQGLLTLTDEVSGISIKRRPLKDPQDSEIKAKEVGMPDIIFSHEKHAVWNGCELCHPDIFGVTKEATTYSMQDIFDGKYCGACHGKVAFVTTDCQLCHTKEVW